MSTARRTSWSRWRHAAPAEERAPSAFQTRTFSASSRVVRTSSHTSRPATRVSAVSTHTHTHYTHSIFLLLLLLFLLFLFLFLLPPSFYIHCSTILLNFFLYLSAPS